MTSMSVLIVDDEMELRKSVDSILQTAIPEIQFKITEACNGQEALEIFEKDDFDLVLMDVRMPGMSGLEALKSIKESDPRTFVVIMTAHSNLQDAVTAIKDGAYDYVEKPVKAQRLTEIVRKSLEARELVSSLALSNPIFDDDVDSEFVGNSQKMKEVFNLIYRLCKVDTTVLVRGENGTGKELVARAIHYNSPRKSGAFVAINCGAIPENLMESEIFGHEKGAFTGAVERKIGKFQLANNGTLFLDEIGELKPDMQVKLLRVLQEKKFLPVGSNREIKTNARIIAATNRNLEKMIEDNTFREDLFYRLNVMPIFLPPLRDRKDDIPALVQSFIKKFSKSHSSTIHSISPEAMECLKNYRWPGNIRELENAIERSFVMETSTMIQVESLPETVRGTSTSDSSENPSAVNTQVESNSSASVSPQQSNMDFELFKEQAEKDFIVSALRANKGKINQTVAQANIPKNTLLRKIKKYSINVDDYKD
ncbi:MAG: sigma-54-dependent Fis family transcriptional regulator [Bdellovibrio sp. CG10_big_fil_rev_8_21_14_0_10_47_8]|nr:MAG: sigma-54-dependent Fis family transcriptional regulator [Bdellovibrio sp. CG10_big_fil_rev_8_21_14_0_10_47_8]